MAWRAGIDLNPIDITDPDQQERLRSLIWPEHDERREGGLVLPEIGSQVEGDPDGRCAVLG